MFNENVYWHVHMTNWNNTAPQKKNLIPNTKATTGKRPTTSYCELLGGYQERNPRGVVRKLGVITPWGGVENSLSVSNMQLQLTRNRKKKKKEKRKQTWAHPNKKYNITTYRYNIYVRI